MAANKAANEAANKAANKAAHMSANKAANMAANKAANKAANMAANKAANWLRIKQLLLLLLLLHLPFMLEHFLIASEGNLCNEIPPSRSSGVRCLLGSSIP